MNDVTIDLVTIDPACHEAVMRLVERSPWWTPTLADGLRAVQDRLYNAVDVAIDGLLADRFPETKGLGVRNQLDCVDPPSELYDLVRRFNKHLGTDPTYAADIRAVLPS